MNPSDIRVDAHGFPIPPTFADLPPPRGSSAEIPGASAAPPSTTIPTSKSSPARPRSTTRVRIVKFALVVMLVGSLAMAISEIDLPTPMANSVADWLASQAERRYHEQDDPHGALAALDRAVAWSDSCPRAYYLRGHVRLELQDVEGGVADFTRLVQLLPHSPVAYMLRGHALQRLGRHDAAIRDMDEAVRLRRPLDPRPLNARAYVRAIAGQDLEAALADVEQALALDDRNAAYLDTRGYIFYLQGRYVEALDDLNEALRIADANRLVPGMVLAGADPHSRRRFARAQRLYDQELAVMYHHRGQVHQKLGNAEQSELDLARGDALGYDPDAGIY